MIEELLSKFMDYFHNIFSKVFVDLIIVAIILLVGFIIGKLLGRLVQKLLHEAEINKILKKAGIKASLENVLGSFTSFFIYFITVIMALNKIGLTTTILQIIFAGFMILLILFTVLALKDFIPNMIAGLVIHKKENIRVGDNIKVDGLEGKIKKINLIETEIMTKNKDIIHIPNSIILRSELAIKKRKK